MKPFLLPFTRPLVWGLVWSLGTCLSLSAQTFQRQYGNNLNNTFTKIIQSGTAYYVLGSDQSAAGGVNLASVTRLDATGQVLWTRRLNVGSAWLDATLTPNGSLFLVGHTLPLDANAQSLMGVIQSNGAFAWVNSYNTTGREAFTRVVRNPSPQSAANPYYILGFQKDPSNASVEWDDVVLLTVSEAGSIGWKRRINNASDDEFSRDLQVLANGDLILAGNRGNNGVVLRFDKTGTYQGGASPEGLSFSFNHVTRSTSGGYFAVGQTFPNGQPYLLRFDDELINLWENALLGLTTVTQVWEAQPGVLYICGTGLFNGKNRAVVMRVTDTGSGAIVDWTRYLDKMETSYLGGSIRLLSGNRLAFVDGRVPLSGGFGGVCAFASVSDLNLTTCITQNTSTEATNLTFTYNGPDVFPIEPATIPQGAAVATTAVTWQQQEACVTACSAAFNAQPLGINPCGLFQFNNTSTGPAPLTYSWNFGDPNSGSNNTSTAMTPTHQFTACGTYTVCLTVTGNGCTNSACQQVVYSEATPPVITCPQNLTLQCNTNTAPPATGVATATDNCTAAADIVFNHADQVAGLMPCDATILRTWSARDKCGNSSTCRQTVFVRDNVPPTFNPCPPNTTVSTDIAQCFHTAVPPNATDNCDPTPTLACTWTDPNGTVSPFVNTAQFPKGVNTVRCTATDDCNNTVTCLYNVTVQDQVPPTIVCPGNAVLVGAFTPAPVVCKATAANLAPTTSDNCTMVNLSYIITGSTTGSGSGDVNGTMFMGSSAVTYTVVDMGNNTRTCSFTVAVRCDSCTCPGSAASQNLIGNGDFSLGNAGFSSAWPFSNSCNTGTYGIATNFNTFCSSWPNLPAHSAPSFLALDGSIGSGAAEVWKTTVTLTPNTNYCFSFWWASVYATNQQAFSVSMDIVNSSGAVQLNVGTETISQSPAAVWKQKMMNFNSGTLSGTYTIRIQQTTSTIFRDWGIDDICLTKVPLPCTAAFTPEPLDPCGKYNFINQSVGATGQLWNFGDPMSGANNTSTLQSPMHQFSKCGTFNVCLTITCADGTTNTICKTVTVTDNVPPIAKCKPGVGVTLNPNCAYNVTTQFVDDGSTDNCQILSLAVNPTTLTGCANHTVTLTVTDWCGNTSTCTMGIQTIETTPPTLTCPPNATVTCQTGLTPWPGVATAVDNCPGAVTITFTDATNGLMPCDATVTRTWKATDACNNMATCTQTVFVRDNVPPAIVCPPSATVACVSNIPPGSATAQDNCDPAPVVTMTVVNTGQLPCNGAIVRTWKATDRCNNMSTCVQTITVKDDVPPTIVCPQNATVNTLPGVCYYQGNIPQPTGTDNCGGTVTFTCSWLTPTQSILIDAQTQFTKGVNTISCIANDPCGNGSQPCTYTLTVRDQEMPDIFCPLSTTVLGTLTPPPAVCKATLNNLTPSITDNCPMTTLAYTISGATTASGTGDASGTMFMQGASTVIYTVTDMAGNSKTCSFKITVKCATQTGGVIGVKYRECNGAPYTNQATVAGWPITLYEEDGVTLLAETATDSSGTYRFVDLPYGIYIIKELPFPGAEPNVPESGQQLVEIRSPQPVPIHFGNCFKECEKCPSTSVPAANLVLNGDFEGGNNSQFMSGYPYFAPAPGMPIGRYSVMNAAQVVGANPQWNCTNHTPGGQLMLVVDGTNSSSNVAWKPSVPIAVQPNNNYVFCAFFNNLVRKDRNYADAQVSIWINGIQVVAPVTLPENPDMWVPIVTLWPSGATTSANIEIRVGNTSFIGTDFAVDDISFRLCRPTACVADFNFQSVNNCDKVQFSSTSQGAVAYAWNFGDPMSGANNTSALQNPMHNFSKCGTYTVCLTITCANGTTATTCKTVTVTDNVPPTALCNPGVGVILNANCTYTVTPQFVDAGSKDNCILRSISVSPTTLTGCRNHVVTLTATDWCGNTSTCSMGIQTGESTPPSITCPPNATVTCQTGLTPWPGTPVATDNCPGTVAVTSTDATTGLMPCDATVTRTWVATDACNNTATCTQTVSVRDNIPPTVMCPPNTTVNTNPGQCFFSGTFPAATATDNCDQTPTATCFILLNGVFIPITPNTQLPKGDHPIRCRAEDDCGNLSLSCTYTLTVRDNEPPKITCPLGMTILGSINADGQCKALVNSLDATVTDNCPMASVTGYVITGATTGTGTGNLSNVSFMQGVSTVTYTATDMAGNTATCSFMVTVRCEACACPAGTFPGQELVANGDFEAGLTGFTSDYTLVSPVCNPGWRNVANSTTVVPMCNNWACTDHTTGSPTGLFFVADGSTTLGQAAWRETVNVAANTKYYLCAFVNNLNEINFDRADPVIEVYIKDGSNVSTLIAGPITLPENPDVWIQIGGTWTSPGSLNGPYRLEFRTANQSFEGNNFAIDDISFRACGSTAPCEAAFVPEPLGPCGKFNFISQSVGQITAYAWNFGDPMSGANNTSTLQNPMHQFSKCGTFNVCLTITCANGTTSTICHPVTVTDNTPPMAKCNLGVGVILNANCIYTVTPQFVDGGSTDNCQIQSLAVNPTTLTGCANHTVTLTVTDWCGNTSTCTMGIQTGESTPPNMTCPPNATVTCQTGLTPWPGTPVAVDNCPGAVAITFTDVTTGLVPCDATVTRTWKATDACNNMATCTQTVFVRDNVPPSIQCPPNTTVACVPNPLPGQATATDNCDPAPAITVTAVNTGQLPCNGAIVRTWKATDRCNNMSTCVQTITVKDDVPPTIMCPPNSTVNTLPGLCYYQGNIPQPTGTDNCGGTLTFICSWLTPTQSILIDAQTQFTKGVNNISCIATDACGNGSQPCNYTLTVQDKEPPRITCPQNMTVQGSQTPPPVVCKATVNNIGPVSATDNCPMTTVTYTITGATTATGNNDASGTMFMQGVSTVVYTVVDMGGNSATCSFKVTVECQPNNFPGFHCGQMVVTCFSGFSNPCNPDPNGPVLALVDERNHALAPSGKVWPSVSLYHKSDWTAANLGQVFGVTIDKNNNVYVAATTVYGKYSPLNTASYGRVYRIDAITGNITVFATLPQDANNPAGLGDIWYDAANDQFFVSNFYDGIIYCLNNVGVPVPPRHYNYAGTAIGTPSPGFVARGERVWAVATHNGRLYFSVWKEDSGRPLPGTNNEIYSVAMLSGVPTGAAVLEKTVPNLIYPSALGGAQTFSNPVSDITFSQSGKMLIAQRTMLNDFGNACNNLGPQAHRGRVIELSGPSWGTEKVFYVGNFDGTDHANSAGGIDYGYESFNPTTVSKPVLCDSMVWTTGDALRFPGYNTLVDASGFPCGNGTGDYAYGIAGMRTSGNSNNNISSAFVKNRSIYIDLDQNLCAGKKLQQGDLEVFKCGCINQGSLCDSISVSSMPFNGPQDTCCFKLTLANQKPNYFTAIQLCAPSGVSFSTVSALNGCVLQGANASQITIVPTGGIPNTFPTLTGKDFVKFCLSNYQNIPSQQIIVKYFGPGYKEVCRDTLRYNCTQKPKCLKVTPTVVCAPDGTYKMTFCVMTSPQIGFNVTSFVLNPPPGITFTPSVFPVTPPLTPGQMQCNFMTTISGPMALDGKNICFSVTAKSGPLGQSDINCCTDTVKLVCVTLPPCVCEKVSASAMSVSVPGKKCCWKTTLTNNYSTTYFTGIQLDVLTPGVTLGCVDNNVLPPVWSLNSSSTSATFTKFPLGSYIGQTEILPIFCLGGITPSTPSPQIVVLKWLDATGKVVCTDTLKLACDPPVDVDCARLVCPTVKCDPNNPGQYIFQFQVFNNSGFTINQVAFTNTVPPNIFPTVFSIPNLANLGTSAVQTATIAGLSPGQTVCFNLKVRQVNAAGNELNCCTRSQKYCFTLPSCDDFCPGNLVQNGNFESGFANGSDETIGLATNWSPIWPSPPLSTSTGDFWSTLPPNNANTAFSVLADPLPASQGNYSGFWCRYLPSDATYREGIMNQLANPIAPNTGMYTLTLKVACISQRIGTLPPLLSVYGTGGATTIPGTFATLAGAVPTNPNLFAPAAVQLGSAYPIPANCDRNFQTISFSINTSSWATPIDRIFLTRDDAPGGGVYLAVDDICLRPVKDLACCNCGGAEELSFGGLGTDMPATCGNTKPVELPCPAPGDLFWFHGNVICNGDSCLKDSVIWNIKDPMGAPVLSGASAMSQIFLGGDKAHFDIVNLNPAAFTPGVVYTITVYWVCGNKTCSCAVKFVFKDCGNCMCGKFTDLFLRPLTGAPSISVVCDNQPPLVPCPPMGQLFHISGNFMCAGTDCPASTPVDWELIDPMNQVVASGSSMAAPNFSIGLSPALLHKAGVYCLKLTGHCGTKRCPCIIKFRIEAPCPNDDCVCGNYNNLFIRSGQGPSKPVSCGGNAGLLNCPPNGQNIVLTGQFQCFGNACPKTTLMDWALYNPANNGIGGGAGILVNPNFSISIPSALLTLPGTYTLALTTFCGNKECICEIKFVMDPPCPSDLCECGRFDDFVWRPTPLAIGFVKFCGDTLTIPCNTQTPPFTPILSGSYMCLGNCDPKFPPIDWQIRTLPAGPVVASGSVANSPGFSLPLLASYFATPGLYELTLSTRCGGVACPPCKFIIKVEPCGNNCTCIPNGGGFTNMSYRPNSGPNQPIACGQTAIWQCVLPTFTMGGNFACQGNNCSPTGTAIPMFWTLKKGSTPITNGTMSGPGFNLSFPSSSFATAGVYTLTLAGVCGTDTCYCEIKIETPGCGDCVCIPNGGGFTNMSYRPNSGPNQPIACGQTAIWQCVLPTFTMGGNFACQGNNCSPTGAAIPMFWTLKKGITPITNGTMSGPGFNLSFPSSSFATAGVYTLTLAGICGKDTCYCEIKIETPGCGDCVCIPNGGGFTNMSYRPNSGPNQPIACGQTAIWQCVLPTFTMGGNFACQGNNCSPAGAAIPMFWTLKKGITPITNGTMSGPGFNLSFPSSSFATAGVYTLTLAGICGKDTCYCEIKIETPGCGCTCGTYADLFWRPAQGAPSQSVKCGDGLDLPCNPSFNPVLSGNFQCKGTNCPTAIPMFWTLTGPTGVLPQSGTTAGPNFNIPLNASYFSIGGTYNLTLGAICGTDTCYCRFTIKAAPCNCWANNCLNFDGTDDFVNVTSPLGAAPGNFSVGCWFRNERTSPAANAFFYRLFGWTGTDRFELGDKNGSLSFFSNPTGPNEVVSTANIRDGRWHYVVITYNGNTVNTFLDAQLVPALTLNVGALSNMPSTFHLGDWGGGASDPRFWDGCIDDFKVWNTALTATQVSDAMQCGADPSNANLLLYFNFNQGIADGNNVGLTTAIATKGSNNGTLSNFALNAQSSNWTYRGASELPACQSGVFLALEGNPGVNTAQRTKVYNGDIYSLGTERTVGNNPIRPTLIRRDAAGTIVWRTVLNIEGYANDFVMTQDGCDFLIVGHRPAFAGNNSAWIARVRNSDGALLWLRTFNLGRRESFTRILLSDNPQNPAFPYVVLGVVNNGNISNDNIHLFTLDDAGTVGNARRYDTGGDDEFFKDLIQLQGSYVMAGNIANRSVLVFTDNALIPEAPRTFRFQQAGPYIWDVEPSFNGRFLYVAGQVSILGQLQGFLAKIDYNIPTAPVVLWSNRFPNVSSFRKVTVRANGDLHALGLRRINANGAEHNVILRGQDNGNALATLWLRHIYRSPESQWTLGDIVHYNGQRVFYTDGRLNNPATYGNMDILKALADNDLASVGPTCLVNLPFTSVALPLALIQLNMPQAPVTMLSTAGGTATQVTLPMRDPCRDEPCECKYENLEFALGQNFIWKNFSCAAPSVSDVPCPLQNQPLYFSGKLTCLGNCQFNGLSWVIKNPSGAVIATGSSPSNPVFSIAITLAMVQTPGVYTIELVGKCGTQECRCVAQFRVKDCPKPCACSPLGTFQADVNAGFNYFKFPAPSCKFQFTPKKLTDCDQVQWKVAKASDLVFTIVGTSTGNAPFQYTFPTDLTQYVVCMDVTRTVPGATPPQTCQYSRCYLIDLDCSILAGAGERGLGAACAGGVVINSGFTQDAEAGGLLSGGAAFRWDASDGDPTVVLAPGRPDSNFVRLRGNRVYSDRLYQDSLPTLSGRTQLRFSFRLSSASVVDGTELVVRLSKAVQDSSVCLGDCQEIMRFAVPTDTALNDLWLTAFSGDSVAVRGQYLTIQVENPLTQDDAALQSVIDIDDICLRSLNFVPVHTAGEAPYQLRLFPNPNTGYFTVELPAPASGNTHLRIADPTGRLVLKQAIQQGAAKQDVQAEGLPSGLYFVQVVVDGKMMGSVRFVKAEH